MKYKHVFWGLVLISVGVLFILNNFGIFEFGWRTLWSLWPLILIFWGISILPVKEWMKIAGLVVVLTFTILFFQRLTQHAPWMHFRHFDRGSWSDNWDNNDDEDSGQANYNEQHLSVPFDSVSRKGVLNLKAAAGNFRLNGQTNDFLDFNKKGYIGDYSLTTSDENAVKQITLRTQESHINGSFRKNQVDIRSMKNQRGIFILILERQKS